MPLRTLIVDDEPIARRVLREELEQFDEVEIAGEAGDGAEALSQIRRLRPDLMFLDLQMPGMDGFEVIRSLRMAPSIPVIVIVTAHNEHAIEAFEAGAIDYLQKPVVQERLAATLERVLRMHPKDAANRLAALQEIAVNAQAGVSR